MAEEYKIQLGVAIDTSDLKTEINKIDSKEKVKLGVDLKVNDIRDRITAYNKNSNNAKLKLGIKLDTSDIKRQISKLNLGDAQTGKGVAIPVDTKSLETSLNEVKVIISSIQSAIGGIGDGSEMKPLLSSVNQIANALGKVENETQSVISALNALSNKDFNINFGINAGGSNNPIARNAAYGNKVRSETLPQLKRQAESLVSYVNDYYKTSYNELEALQKLVHGTKLGTGDFYQSFLFGEDSVASRMSSGSLAGQMQAFKQYIDMFKQAASLKGINLESVTSQFSMSADDLIKDAQDIQTGAKEVKDSFEQLKGIFGASIDGESLSAQLTPIVDKLEEIRVAIGNLSNAESLGGLSASFDKLSSTLETLLANAKQVQEVLGASGINTAPSNQAKEVQKTADIVVQSEERKQQAIKDTRRLISDSAQSSIDGVSSKSVDSAFRIDESDSLAFKREMENLVSQWTDAKGKLTDIKINTETFYDADTGKNIEKISRAQVTYNNELGETIKKTIALRQIGSKSSVINGEEKTSPVYGFVEVAGQYSKSLEKTKNQTDAFVKQQKQAVTNLTNQINQINRAATDKNASRPIKDSAHLDVLKSKYDEITLAIQRMENASSDTFVDEQNNVKALISDFKSLVSEYKNADNVSDKMRGTDFASGFEIAKNNLAKFKAEAKDFPQIVKTISNLDTSISEVGDAYSLNKFNEQLRVARSELAKIKSETAVVDNINKKLKGSDGNTSFDVDIKGVESDFSNLSNKSEDLRKKIELLKQEFSNMQIASANGDIESLVSSYERYENVLEDVHNQLKLNKRAEKDYNAAQKLKDDKASLKLDMVNWLKKNTRAAKEYGDEINRLISSLDKLDDAGVKGVRRQFGNYKKAADSQGLTGLSLFDQIKDKFREYSAYFSVAELFMYAEQGLRDMFEQVKLIDSAMTELKKVTNETDDTYNQFLTNAASRAKAIGTTIDGLVSSTADFARLGYDFVDSQGLAEVANIYAVVGDDIDSVETATQSLISTLTAFKDEASSLSNEEFALSIVDKMNEVSNNFAISSGGIGEALQRSASSMMAANNSLDETIALITAANTVVQDPASVGTAFKTSFLNCLYVQKCA